MCQWRQLCTDRFADRCKKRSQGFRVGQDRGKAMSPACCIDVPTTVRPVDHETQPRQSLSQPSGGSTCCLAKREDTDMTRVVVNQRLKLQHVNGHLGQEAVPLAQSLRSGDPMQSNNDTAFGNRAEKASRAAGCAHGSHGFLVGLASALALLRLGTTNRLTETSPDSVPNHGVLASCVCGPAQPVCRNWRSRPEPCHCRWCWQAATDGRLLAARPPRGRARRQRCSHTMRLNFSNQSRSAGKFLMARAEHSLVLR